uniref:Uncharacterized protein n=1 Tax=viral metagenome TaxID=1070528 RepID=A0A6C0F5I1_9ZZZZ|tara:strand:- start:11263 stop:11634 length:372 start_codon:yes stop_codon:yes gene_type:complete
MAWIPKPGSFHYGKTEKDYRNLLGLYDIYILKPAPIEELKKAALADGYPPEKVERFKYKPESYYLEILRLIQRRRNKINHNVIKKVIIEDEDADDNDIDLNETMDIDLFQSDEEEEYKENDDD